MAEENIKKEQLSLEDSNELLDLLEKVNEGIIDGHYLVDKMEKFIANKDIIPAAIKYANILADNIEKTSKIYTGMTTVQEDLLKVVLENITVIKTGITCLESKLFELNKINSISEQLAFAHDEFLKGLNDLREPCDTLEKIIDRNIWPMPTYKDLLFFL